jgi:GNAT superfamily N-acetyltransferase
MDIHHQAEETGMVLDLTAYEFTSNNLHQQITIVEDLKKLADYAKVIAENWSPPDQHVIQYYHLTADGYLNPKNEVILLVFYLDGQPVSSVELFPTDRDTIGLYGFATLEAFRGKGIGSALMTYSLNLAKERGYKRAILQASEDGIGIYKRMGFKVINTYFEYA